MYATPKDLVDAFRAYSRDTVDPYLWSDSELYQYATEAEASVAQELLCLQDMSSAAAVLNITAGEPTVLLHPSTIRVRSAFFIADGRQRSLELRTMDGMRDEKVFVDTGPPRVLILGGSSGSARIYPIPTEDGTLQLTIFRTPLKALSTTAKFEIPFHYTPALLEWMSYLAYRKHDADTFDPGRSAAGMAGFMEYMRKYQRVESLKNGGTKDGTVAYGGL